MVGIRKYNTNSYCLLVYYFVLYRQSKRENVQAKGRKGNNMKAKRYIYEERKNVLIAKVYNYDLNTAKEMEARDGR